MVFRLTLDVLQFWEHLSSYMPVEPDHHDILTLRTFLQISLVESAQCRFVGHGNQNDERCDNVGDQACKKRGSAQRPVGPRSAKVDCKQEQRDQRVSGQSG